ncbi:MAG: HAMP domain-containing sensor histidine kinase [Gemmobacter sp.]|nr:HAMP domain-containing sensor histidine kinase [Gemmobacter sp.]
MARPFGSLRARAIAWVLSAATVGALAAWVWMTSLADWQAHLTQAYQAGIAIHDTLDRGAPAPDGVRVVPLPPDDPANRTGVPPRAGPGLLETQIAFLGALPGAAGTPRGGRLQVRVLSPDLRYPVAQVSPDGGSGPAAGMANLARLLASYCSDPVVFARTGTGPWFRIDAPDVWSCAAQPRDLRLPALIALAVALAVLLSRVVDTTTAFGAFATALRDRRGLGVAGPDSFLLQGPDELRETQAAVNTYLAEERDRLERRAMVLSGVSHDLGTPAARLRLRTALIGDADLRGRFDADIDRMTGMIESVLTYTQAEIGLEPPRELSLTALVEAVVADYQDMDQPVSFLPVTAPEVATSRSLFSPGKSGARLRVPETRRILVRARPLALQRAIGNLIDNALKYGRRATISLTADAERATISVLDAGTSLTEADLVRLTEPFTRGTNAGLAPGFGLGLTIVSTIASQHGGALEFERRPQGLCARLILSRH